jgi:hypothetical protein
LQQSNGISALEMVDQKYGVFHMNKITIACLAVLSTTLFATLPAYAEEMGKSPYCAANNFDPECMDETTFKMRGEMMKMTKDEVSKRRKIYCDTQGNGQDYICEKGKFESSKGFDSGAN